MTIKDHIRDVPDYPSTGITYRDISPLLHNSNALRHAVDSMYYKVMNLPIDVVVGIEPRGLIFAGALALKLQVGMAEAKKLSSTHPFDVVGIDYAFEMGTDRIEMMRDAIKPGD